MTRTSRKKHAVARVGRRRRADRAGRAGARRPPSSRGRGRRASRRGPRRRPRCPACRRARWACRGSRRPGRPARRRPSPGRRARAAGSGARRCGAASACRAPRTHRDSPAPASCSRSAASSSSVCRRTWSCSMTVVWNSPKSESRTSMPASERSMSALDDLVEPRDLRLQRLRRPGCRARQPSCAPPAARLDPIATAVSVWFTCTTAELLAVGVEADGVVALSGGRRRAARARRLGDLQPAQDAVEGEHDLRRADAGAHLREGRLEVARRGRRPWPRGARRRARWRSRT